MILFLRDDKNNSIVDVECYVKTKDGDKYIELSAAIDIRYYSIFLLENLDKKIGIISDFSVIDELRGWLWETYFLGGKNDPEKYDDIIARLRVLLGVIAKRYDLSYVED